MMLEYNLLDGYPSPDNPRIVGENLRQINHRIIASKRGKNFLMEIEILVMVDINMMEDGNL